MCRLHVCVYIYGRVSFGDLPMSPQVHHGHWTHRSIVECSWVGGGEEADLSLCPLAARKMCSTPALLGDIWTCRLPSGGFSSTDCQSERGPIDTGGGEELSWVNTKEEMVIAVLEEGRYVDGGVVSCGLFLLKTKI